MPTIKDFLELCLSTNLKVVSCFENNVEEMQRILQIIQQQLQNCLNSDLEYLISRPRNFPVTVNIPLTVFSLNKVDFESKWSNVATLAAYTALLRQALQLPKCILFMDECPPLLLGFCSPSFLRELCGFGFHFGIQVALIIPDFININPLILQHLTRIIVGKIAPSEVKIYEKCLHYPHEIISTCATKSFAAMPSYSTWLVDGYCSSSGSYQYITCYYLK